MTGTPIDLAATAQALVAPGKGILAADESTPTIGKRFHAVGLESTEENRRAYREMLFTTPGVEADISGVILFDETIRQDSSDGTPFADLLASRGISPGIKVDKGAKPLAGAGGEKATEGLDGLRERLAEYHQFGARFTKWRAVLSIGPGIPTRACISTNAIKLARFAALSQEADLVPIIEPEVLMDGTHPIERSYEVTADVIGALFAELHAHHVRLEGLLLKVNMVLSGYDCPEQATKDEIAEWTLRCLSRHLPPVVPGVVFLSGGQSEEMATVNLDAINRAGSHPWELSFSFGRALQSSALRAWAHDPTDVTAAQGAFQRRAGLTAAARRGSYEPA
ncbi:MAG: class I fructose-bisphosphate aldolase [Chloroflexota bacterium]|nr:class I fructose-bisphosphate aldolase [Chloroflexota bacterium]